METQLFQLLQNNVWVFVAISLLLGLIVGSFLNVVIYRLPVMMERSWRAQCRELLEDTPETSATEAVAAEPRFNLITPRSRCPHCGHPIGALENVPVISYLLQGGKCRHCGGGISVRYPLVEMLTGILTAVVAWHFGFGWPALAAMALTWALIALTFIDLDHQLLPDDITLPFLWLGLLLSLQGFFASPTESIVGAAAGYLILWGIYHLFRLLTGKEGMGYGDFKLLGLFGAWLGWQALPAVILLSSVVGAVVGVSLIALRRHERSIPIPFGPYLAAAGWITLLWGEQLNAAYLRLVGLG